MTEKLVVRQWPQFRIRVPADLHGQLCDLAKLNRRSMNAEIVLQLERAVAERDARAISDLEPVSAQRIAQDHLLYVGIDDHEKPRYTTRRLREEMKRAREQGRQEVIDELRGTCVAVIPHPPFKVGDPVEKHTGDYHAKGEVRGIFAMNNGAIRYVVEHPASGGGSFCHIYSEKNLRRVEP